MSVNVLSLYIQHAVHIRKLNEICENDVIVRHALK